MEEATKAARDSLAQGLVFTPGQNVFSSCNSEHVHPTTNYAMKLYCNGDWVFWKKDEKGHYQVIKKINVTGGDAHWFREKEIRMIMQDDGNLVVY